MADNARRYYWLKLQEGFFSDKKIKKLRKIAGGDTYTIIYLKMQLIAMKTNGILVYTGLEGSFEEELALELDEDDENVSITINYLLSCGLMETADNREYFLPDAVLNTGSEGNSAKRVREYRERKNALVAPDAPQPKTNAERQRTFKAKKSCEEKQHIPFIEDHMNNKRYGGNYYIVIKRDKFKCAVCGSIENLCVHHIDGYDEKKPENNHENKMVTLCRGCHSTVHAGTPIPTDILDGIDYFDDGNEMLLGNTAVTICNGEKEIEKEKIIEIDYTTSTTKTSSSTTSSSTTAPTAIPDTSSETTGGVKEDGENDFEAKRSAALKKLLESYA